MLVVLNPLTRLRGCSGELDSFVDDGTHDSGDSGLESVGDRELRAAGKVRHFVSILCVCMCTYVCMLCVCVYVCMYICTYVCVCGCMYVGM